jgi:hypothetical protein
MIRTTLGAAASRPIRSAKWIDHLPQLHQLVMSPDCRRVWHSGLLVLVAGIDQDDSGGFLRILVSKKPGIKTNVTRISPSSSRTRDASPFLGYVRTWWATDCQAVAFPGLDLILNEYPTAGLAVPQLSPARRRSSSPLSTRSKTSWTP